MRTISQANELREAVTQYKQQGKSIAFVPTMGNLHAGHISLIQQAKTQADVVIASIFVNPLQFSPNEDFDQYPRTVNADLQQLKEQHCDLVFLPEEVTLLPKDSSQQTRVSVPGVSEHLEGLIRGGHLTGVATIVCKLFNLVQPDVACFGKKDYQQWRMIQKMVHDLDMNIRIIGCETVREPDGLALSSRNQYLNTKQRVIAPLLQRTLQQCSHAILKQQHPISAILQQGIQQLEQKGFKVNYLEVRSQKQLSNDIDNTARVLLCAAQLGETRLLDNIEIDQLVD